MKTILFVSHEHSSVLGCTLSLYNLIHSLPKDYNPIVLIPNKGPAYDFFQSKQITCLVSKFHVDFVGEGYGIKYFLTFPIRIIRDYYQNTKTIFSIKHQLQDVRVDVVHTNTSSINIGPKLAKQLNAAHVWHLREMMDLSMGFQPLLGWKRLKKQIASSDAVISITEAVAKHHGVYGRKKSYVIFDAVRSIHDIVYHPNKEKYFIFCGAISPIKSPDIAVKAFEIFNKNIPGYRLKFVGNYKDSVKNDLLNLTNSETQANIEFLGYSEKVDELISKASALLMCSQYEGQGRVSIEAMFMSCPLIARNAGGTKEIVFHMKNGILFDTIEECAEAMKQVVTDKDLSKNLISEALNYAKENFLEETYGQKMREIYNSITSK